ncbi:MAG: type II toxin-antitoxin system Phd/YefM family antitoxin [Chloroflexi bacterium]|nr:type II toxin-antitoxin system Phd/YefM family antitoxin [Chloroflexota bacterium]
MLKTITSSDLRVQVKQVLNEVGYGQNQYVVEKFGEPTAAIISIADFRLLQKVRQAQSAAALADVVATVRQRGQELDMAELTVLMEEARADYYHYPLRGTGRVDLDPSAPVLAADEWDAARGKLLNDSA